MRTPPRALLVALERVNGWLEALERAVLSGGVLLMAMTGVANVVGRNLFGESVASAEELNQILMVLITFLGIGYGVRHARHIRMSAVYEQLGLRHRKTLLVASSAGTAALLFAMAYFGARYAADVRGIGSVTPVLQLPLWTIYVCVPAGLCLGALQYILAAVRNLTSPGLHLSYQRREGDEPPASGLS